MCSNVCLNLYPASRRLNATVWGAFKVPSAFLLRLAIVVATRVGREPSGSFESFASAGEPTCRQLWSGPQIILTSGHLSGLIRFNQSEL